MKTETNEQSEINNGGLHFDTQVLHRAKALIAARQYRETYSSTVSPTKTPGQGHHTLTKQNRDFLFTSVTISSFELNVTEVVGSTSDVVNEQGIVLFVCQQLTLSIHRRQIDQRIRFGLKDASAISPKCGKLIQCGYLDESAFARRVREVQDERFIRIAAEVCRKNESKSEQRPRLKVKLKLNVGPVEIVAQSLVDTLENLISLQVESKTGRQIKKSHDNKSDSMAKLIGVLMGSSELSSSRQSYDIDLQLRSLDIYLANDDTPSLFTITGISIRLARRCSPHCLLKSRGQFDFRIVNVQLHSMSWVRA